jgi:hypothetical protein
MQKRVFFPALHQEGLALLLWLGFFAPFSAQANTYFLSPSGNDLLAGTSPATAWQTLNRVIAGPILPGDSILLQANQVFSGSLYFYDLLSTPSQPLYLGVWGNGYATIDAGTSFGLDFRNCAGVEIHKLRILGDGILLNDHRGLYVYGDSLGQQLSHFVLDSLEVSGFNRGGISFGDNGNDAYFTDIQITHCQVHHNGDHGIEIERPFSPGVAGFPHRNVYIAHCEAYFNTGQVGKNYHHTGNGILVGNTDSVLIEYCVAHHNGANNTYLNSGPVGIWVWDCNHAVIQYNESHHNQTASAKDGGGFDLDGGTINSVIQYNYSHDNDGPGFLLAQFPGSRPMYNNHIRYNISQNDARAGVYGGIHLWRGNGTVMDSLYIYNNTIYMAASPTGAPKVFYAMGGGMNEVRLFNNIFISISGPELMRKSHQWADIKFYGNAYFASGGPFQVYEGGMFNSLLNWRIARNQEELPNGTPVGYEGNPQLVSMGMGQTIGDPTLLGNLVAYQLSAGSPLIDLGLDLNSLAGLDMGPVDFFQEIIPVSLTFDIGASEGPGNPLSASLSVWQAERAANGKVELSWELPAGLSIESLVVQRRGRQEVDFVELAQLSPARKTWVDAHPLSKHSYYRLLIRQTDGSESFLRVREVGPMARSQEADLFPNPVDRDLQVHLPQHWQGGCQWEIRTTSGQLVRQGKRDIGNGEIWEIKDLHTLAEGIYFLQVNSPYDQVNLRFVKM